MMTIFCGHLWTVLVMLMLLECIRSLELLELRVPAHVALGARASLSCRWALSPADVLYSVKWYKDGKEFFRHVPRDSEPRRKFPLPGVDVEKWDALGSSLVLSGVAPTSGGRYRCEVSGERPLFQTVSEHADMTVAVLPNEGPVISGLRTRYRIGERVQVNCSSGRSRPVCQLSWYINGEPAPNTALLPVIHQVHVDRLESATLRMNFEITEAYAKNNIKVKCLATLDTLYWRSNEESALLSRMEGSQRIVKNVQHTNHKKDQILANHGFLFKSSYENIVSALLAALYVKIVK